MNSNYLADSHRTITKRDVLQRRLVKLEKALVYARSPRKVRSIEANINYIKAILWK